MRWIIAKDDLAACKILAALLKKDEQEVVETGKGCVSPLILEHAGETMLGIVER